MSARQLSGIEQRLIDTARRLAVDYAAGQLSNAELRIEMRRAIAEAHTAAMLAGTGANRSAEIDAALRETISAAYDTLDAALAIIESADPDESEITRRLEAFVADLETTQERGEQLTENPVSPLVPVAIGAGLAALIGLARRAGQGQAPTPPTPAPGANIGRVTLPRVDSSIAAQLYGRMTANVDSLAGQLARGEITLDAWYDAMRRQVIQAHSGMYRIGAGRALSEDDRARLNARISRQLEYLDNWRGELEGAESYSEAGIARRGRMYMDATNASIQEGRLAAIGLPALPALPGDGTTVCRTNCQCNWRIVQLEGNGNYDAYWRLNPAEHCDTCLERAEKWSPIRIRAGVLGPYARIFD